MDQHLASHQVERAAPHELDYPVAAPAEPNGHPPGKLDVLRAGRTAPEHPAGNPAHAARDLPVAKPARLRAQQRLQGLQGPGPKANSRNGQRAVAEHLQDSPTAKERDHSHPERLPEVPESGNGLARCRAQSQGQLGHAPRREQQEDGHHLPRDGEAPGIVAGQGKR